MWLVLRARALVYMDVIRSVGSVGCRRFLAIPRTWPPIFFTRQPTPTDARRARNMVELRERRLCQRHLLQFVRIQRTKSDKCLILNALINIMYVAPLYTPLILLYCAWRWFLELYAHSRIATKPLSNIQPRQWYLPYCVTYIFERNK